MKLEKEVLPKNICGYPRRYLLLSEVTDKDAEILELCNMVRAIEYDKKIDGVECEAWMVM